MSNEPGFSWLFLDMNAYFASVEQECCPSLRGRPIAVAPVLVESTCCIAASYEAKHFGIRTGTRISDARRLCPELQVVEARPTVYVEYHEKIVEAVTSIVPVHEVHSIDEMSCRLLKDQQIPEQALALAREMKRAIRDRVGQSLKCSVGLATNRILAKVAADMQKPDGLTTIFRDDLPQKLYQLSLQDLPGIGRQMHARLERWGIHTVEQLCALPPSRLHEIWHSVVGLRWWHVLRGHDLPEKPPRRRSVGHSHVLPPEFRTDEGACGVLSKLIHKAAARMRLLGYWARRMTIQLIYARQHPSWKISARLGTCQDTQSMLQSFTVLWKQRPPGGVPLKVSITLHSLVPDACVTRSLFPEDRKRLEIARVMDDINARLGPCTIYLGPVQGSQHAAPMRISFTHIPNVKAEGDKPPRSKP